MFDSKIGLVGFILMFPIFIIFLLLVRWEYEIDGILSMMTLMIANGSLSVINSSKHTELGRVFWLSKDYKILRFIKYNKNEYSKLPIVFLLITINFIFSLLLVGFTFVFKHWNMIPVIIAVASLIGVTFIFSIVEYGIDKIKQ